MLDFRIGKDKGKHGGHVGHDHSRALGHAEKLDRLAVDEGGANRDLPHGVGGHNGLGHIGKAVGGKGLRRLGNPPLKTGQLQLLANDAGGADLHQLRSDIQGIRRHGRGKAGQPHPFLAGAGIGDS